MSQVEDLKKMLQVAKGTRARIATLQGQIAADKESLKGEEEAYRRLSSEILDLIERMDCRSPGNMGFETRLMRMLEGLV